MLSTRSAPGVRLFLGTSAYSHSVRADIESLGPDVCTVIVVGPTGSGKKVVIQALHAASGRRELVRIPAVTLEKDLARNELFGALRGAYTGADRDRLGLVRLADGGTLAIDDADDLPMEVQLLLLEIAEHAALRPVGGERCFLADVRLIICFQTLPEVLVKRKRLREDLFYRLDQERIVLRPLSEHLEDVPALVQHVLELDGQMRNAPVPAISRLALELLMSRDWPGNVRELRAAVEKGCRRARRGIERAEPCRIGVEHFGFLAPPLPATGRGRRARMSTEQLRAALSVCGGNVTRTAERYGISQRTLWRRVKEHGIDLAAAQQ